MCAVGHGEEYISDCKGDEELEGQLLADIPAVSVDAVVPNGAERKSASFEPPFCGVMGVVDMGVTIVSSADTIPPRREALPKSRKRDNEAGYH